MILCWISPLLYLSTENRYYRLLFLDGTSDFLPIIIGNGPVVKVQYRKNTVSTSNSAQEGTHTDCQ